MVFALTGRYAKALNAGAVRLRTLEEATVATDGVPNAILSRAVEFWSQVNKRSVSKRNGKLTFRRKDNRVVSPRWVCQAEDLGQTLTSLTKHRRKIPRYTFRNAHANYLDEDVRDKSRKIVADQDVKGPIGFFLQDGIHGRSRRSLGEVQAWNGFQGFCNGVGIADGS